MSDRRYSRYIIVLDTELGPLYGVCRVAPPAGLLAWSLRRQSATEFRHLGDAKIAAGSVEGAHTIHTIQGETK